MQIFMKHNTIRLNSRVLGSELQQVSSGQGEYINAHTTLRTIYGDIRSFCRAFPKEFLVSEVQDRSVGGCYVHVLRPLLTGRGGVATSGYELGLGEVAASEEEKGML